MTLPKVPMTFPRGFDAAAEEDFLGRWPLARKVALTVTSVPATCSVRIGVFGRWGTGKTSILNFVRQLVEADGHIVVEFSPWGHTDSAQMWQAFMAAIVKRLEDDGQNVKGAWKASSFFRRTIDAARKLSDARGESKAVVNALDPFVKEFFSFTSDDLRAATETLGENRRILVLVDDVDRTDPRLVPELLFALRKLLDLPGMSWVLAIDPELVGKALAEHHPGFGSAIDFLEKILEFMFWLPEPTQERLWRLAERDLQAFQSGIDANIIRQELALLPNNPRSLRTFVRHLWSLKPELDRHGTDEIDHRLLIFAVLLRTQYPRLCDELLKEGELLNELSILWLHSRSDRVERGRHDESLKKLLKVVEATVADRQRAGAEALLRRLGEHHIWTPERFRYHAGLLDQPATVTHAEFKTALDSDSGLPAWLDAHAANTRLPRGEVVAALFDQAVSAHDLFLQIAADAATQDELRLNVATVLRLLRLIERLGLEQGGFTGNPPSLTGPQYRILVTSISKWAHFRGPEYEGLREAEAALLCKIVEGADGEPFLFLNALAPWDERSFGDDDPNRAQWRSLRTRLIALAERKAAPILLDRLAEPGGVSAILGIAEQSAARYLLFRAASPLWAAPLRQLVGALLATGAPQVVENALDILARLDTSAGRGVRDEVSVPELEKLGRDQEIVTWLWNAGAKKAPNVRRFSSLKKLRTFLEAQGTFKLAEPSWWRRLEEEQTQLTVKAAEVDGPTERDKSQ